MEGLEHPWCPLYSSLATSPPESIKCSPVGTAMRLLDMEEMLLAAGRGEVSELRVGPLYAAPCALPSRARGFLSRDVIVRVTSALAAVASQVMRGLCAKHDQ